ncbi:MAG TPA: PKD domain-containing protein [Ferruginibacter sp.]|nr:PKD domain-containing protein [Ferruginibacter sp.]
MKKILVFSFFLLLFSNAYANHISGGEMIYQYIGPGTSPNTKIYRITLRLFRDNNGGGAAMPTIVTIGVFNNNNNSQVAGSPFNVNQTSTAGVPVVPPPACMLNPPILNYSVASFTFTVELPNNTKGYTAAYQTCCRIFPLENVFTESQPAQGEGSTYSCTIPGTNQLASGNNSSPQFRTELTRVCYSSPFTFDFGASDPDGDSLVYSFCNAFNRGAATNATNVTPSTPPFQTVNYINGFSGSSPLGGGATLNLKTGLISGVAPPNAGRYVVCVCIDEYRKGVLIGRHRKDFILNVSNCDIATATLLDNYPSCDGYTVTFKNLTPSFAIQTYDWDFGDGNTSTQAEPVHPYGDTGVYILKLVVNRGLPCSDSATSIVKVFPGFFPDFAMSGQCQNTPIQFTDITTADFGFPNRWSWNFGDIFSTNNTSTLQNPTHVYSTTGQYNISFIVETSKGCIDTIPKTITIIDKPALSVPNDTLICYIDTLQLNAVGTGSFAWTPNYMISNTAIGNPLVSPDVPTTYRVSLTDPFGCVATDSVKVDVRLFVTLATANDSTICQGDPTVLKINSDALHYVWTETPAGNTLNDPTLKNPTATPFNATTYNVVANIGKCVAQGDITLTTVPYPAANAGADQLICIGNSTQLHASGGSIYSWSPTAFLNAANIPNPVVINPTDNVRYIVTVRDVLGCPKPVKDTMIVTVAKIVADAGPRDTAVVVGQPLQLGASGSTNYAWTPSTWLSDASIKNPVSTPQSNIEYVVRVSNVAGCFDTDTILVKVYKVSPGFYVPSAFSPNGDQLNDIFRPIAIGMKSVDVFRVYNRWGQLLYSGSGNTIGWDGTFGGKGQEAATYVWHGEGVDYLNNKIKAKGYVVLIR